MRSALALLRPPRPPLLRLVRGGFRYRSRHLTSYRAAQLAALVAGNGGGPLAAYVRKLVRERAAKLAGERAAAKMAKDARIERFFAERELALAPFRSAQAAAREVLSAELRQIQADFDAAYRPLRDAFDEAARPLFAKMHEAKGAALEAHRLSVSRAREEVAA